LPSEFNHLFIIVPLAQTAWAPFTPYTILFHIQVFVT